jgi:hypothetical protein
LGTFSRVPGVIEIGSAPDAWTEGYENITNRLTEVFRGLAGVSIEPGDVKAFQEGTVAWLADRPTMTTPEGSGCRPGSLRCSGAKAMAGSSFSRTSR